MDVPSDFAVDAVSASGSSGGGALRADTSAAATRDPQLRGRRRRAICRIAGVAVATPQHSIGQEQSAALAVSLQISGRYSRALPALYRQTGVRRRGSVLLERTVEAATERSGEADEHCGPSGCQSFYRVSDAAAPGGPGTAARMLAYEQHAGELACETAEAALSIAGVAARQVTHLITVSCSGFAAPGLDVRVIQRLGLQEGVLRTNVGFMGCHGAINGLRVAAASCGSDPRAIVLLNATELCSLHQQYGDDPQQLVANALFADGSASVVLRPPRRHHGSATPGIARRRHVGWRVVDSASRVLPDTQDLMSWKIGDNGFRMTLSPRVPDLIRSVLRGWVDRWLARSGIGISDVSHWLIHPGGPRIVEACGEALGLPPEATAPSLEVLAQHGNMSSPTVLFLLERLVRANASGYAAMLAFGPGLCIEAALLRR